MSTTNARGELSYSHQTKQIHKLFHFSDIVIFAVVGGKLHSSSWLAER
jgi:hypothetical protein